MEWQKADFSRGVVAAYDLVQQDRRRIDAASVKLRQMIRNGKYSRDEMDEALDATADAMPLWMQICGLNPWRERGVPLVERRAGIGRLLRVVEQMYRAEVRKARGGVSGTRRFDANGRLMDETLPEGVSRIGNLLAVPEEISAGETLAPQGIAAEIEREETTASEETANAKAEGGTPLGDANKPGGRGAPTTDMDPLGEICFYLGLPKSKLSELSLQRMGLRVNELGDSIRVEGMKSVLRAKFRPLVREWKESLTDEQAKELAEDGTFSAWRFVKWIRGRGRAETRQKLAWEVGVPTRGRLGRAVFVSERTTIEELEIAVALEVIRELGGERGELGAAAVGGARGAELGDVGGVEGGGGWDGRRETA